MTRLQKKIEQDNEINKGGNMKRILVAVLFLMFLAGSVWASTEYKSNTYQITKNVGGAVGITFPYPSRDITIINGAAANAIWVDIHSDSGSVGTVGTAGSFILKAGLSITFNNYIAEGITLAPYTQTASPVSVIVTY